MIDQTVNHYKITGKIGSGGMGEVYLAQDTKLHRQVALKFLPIESCADETVKARFAREAEAAAALSHPNVVTIYEVGEYAGRPYLAMEYVEGRTLDRYLQETRASLTDIIALALQICEGLSAAHERGITHRDVKPANIMVDAHGRVRLLDFGLATIMGASKVTKTGTTIGTLAYMSPEQTRGDKIDQRSDVFSLGVVLYEMITGRRPFTGDTEPALIYAIGSELPEPLARFKSGVPAELQAVVSKMLEKGASLRYPTAAAIVPDLRKLATREQATTRPIRKRLGRWRAIAAGVVILVTAVALIRGLVGPKATNDQGVQSLAVLYLRNLGSTDSDYLCYGVTDDLITDLSRIGSLRISPTLSVLALKDSVLDVARVGKRLRVGLILDGSLLKTDSSVHVSAQLIDVASGKNVWASRWESPLRDLSSIKQSLAKELCDLLHVAPAMAAMSGVGGPETVNAKAYDYYLRGKYAFKQARDTSDVATAQTLFRQALAEDSTLLVARIGIARIYISRRHFREGDEELALALVEARRRQSRSAEAIVLRAQAVSADNQSRLDDAMQLASEALIIDKEIGNLAGEAADLGLQILEFGKRGKNEEAITSYQRVIEINSKRDDRDKELVAIYAMNNTYLAMGKYEMARQGLHQGLLLARAQQSPVLECKFLDGLSSTFGYVLDSAIWYEEQSLAIAKQLNDRSMISKCLSGLSGSYHNACDYRRALAFAQEAAEMDTTAAREIARAEDESTIGFELNVLGDYEGALAANFHALKLARAHGIAPTVAVQYSHIGDVYVSSGATTRALRYLDSALSSDNGALGSERGYCYSWLTTLYFQIGQADSARHYCDKLQGVVHDTVTANEDPGLEIVGNAYSAALDAREGNAVEGIRKLGDAVEKARALGDCEIITDVQRLLGETMLKYSLNQAGRNSALVVLKDALQQAKEKEIGREIKWIGDLLN